MKKPRLQQRGERRIAAALRIALAAALLAVQVLFVVLTTRYLKDHFALIYGALEGIALITALYIYNKPGDLSYRVAWIIPILFVPVVGLILYLLWGGDTQRKRLQRQTAPKLPPEEPESLRNRSALNADRLQRALPGWSRVYQYLSSRGFYLYQNTKAVYLPEGALLLEDILGRIKAAERFIFMEYFILAEGKLWDRMSAALCERARSGVEVKIIFDDFGNIKRFSAESLQTLRDAGVEVIVFNPVHEYVNRLYFNYRDHRKITVIDGETAYTGGVNIADEYANLIDRFGYWKDSGIRLEGEGVWGLTAAFLNMWSFLGGELHEERDYYRPHTSPASDGFCQPFLDGPQNNPDNPAEDTFLQLIGSARRFLYITTPYFIPDENIMRALCIAGDGGVDVRLMLPGTPDHWYADAVADSYIGELLEHHVKVYRYTPGFLHAKSIMVDREAAFVGSVNFDYRSFELHYECGVMLYGASAIESLLEDMDGILDKSHAVTPEEWAHRGLLRRMFGSMCLLMATNVMFVKMLLSVLSYYPSGLDVLPWMVLVVTIVKVAKKADSILARIGLNPAMTGDPLGRGFPGAMTMMVVRSMVSNAAHTLGRNGNQPRSGSGNSKPNAPTGPRSGGSGSASNVNAPSHANGYHHSTSAQQNSANPAFNQESISAQTVAAQTDTVQSAAEKMAGAFPQAAPAGTGKQPNSTRKTAVPPGTRRAPGHVAAPKNHAAPTVLQLP